MDKKDLAQDKALIKKAFKQHDAQEHKGSKGTDLTKLKRGGFLFAAPVIKLIHMSFPHRNICDCGKPCPAFVQL